MLQKTRLSNLFCGILLALSVGMTGCVTMVDGTRQPDYALIEFGSVAAFTVLVNEVETTPAKVQQTYDAFDNIETMLLCVDETCPPVDLSIIKSLLITKVPVEYQALMIASINMIMSRIELYVPIDIPTSEQAQMVTKIILSVTSGAKLALEPHLIK